MRLSSALSVLAGALMLGWAAQGLAATAAAPPAAPIFYCPRGAAAPQKACPAPSAVTTHHRRHGRVEQRVAGRSGDEDVSASQAFIYRYELLHHGFDAAAADQAWRGGHEDGGEHWAEMDRHMDGGHHMDGAPFEHRADVDAHLAGLDQHMAAIDRWGHDADRHFGDLEQHVAKNDERLASVDRRVGEIDSHAARPCCHGARGGNYHYERHGMTGDGAYGYSYERRERRSSGGWSYGDAGGWDWRGGYGDWRDGDDDDVLQYSGRDANGYLTWPGKAPGPDGERK